MQFIDDELRAHTKDACRQQYIDHLEYGSASKHPTTCLLDLPNEILTHAVGYLAQTPPSIVKALAQPDHNLTNSSDQPMKQLSQANLRLRTVTLPVLFRHARLDPYHVAQFLTFVNNADLCQHIITVAARLQGPCNHLHPAWWKQLVNRLPNLSSITVLAAPHIFSELSQIPIDMNYSWAFKIPFQTMTLSFDAVKSACGHFLPVSVSQTHTTDTNSLFSALHWDRLCVNESSHLSAYSTYEYFLKGPPSLLTSLQRQFSTPSPSLTSSQTLLLPTMTGFLANLVTFSYTAIFPFYNHVDEVLKCVRRMERLKRFFVKLCPEPESTILQDELERNKSSAGRTEGRIDINDPWNELETSYTLIPHTIIYLTTDGCLEEFQTDDVKMIGIRDTLVKDIDRRLEGLGCWAQVSRGLWRRDTSGDI